MKIFFDTSVLLAGMIEAHPRHGVSFSWLKRAKAREFAWGVSAHTLAELYATMTAIPSRPRITPEIARQLVHENIEKEAQVIPLSNSDYFEVIKNMSRLNLFGAVIYDGLIAHGATKFGADHLLTLNHNDFSRLFPQRDSFLIIPS
jgi:predicted nucleic acid-binding protein